MPKEQQSSGRAFRKIGRTPDMENASGWRVEFSNGDLAKIIEPPAGMAARKVRAGWQARPTGSFASVKCDVPLYWESSSEYAALLICEYDPEIRSIRTQPYKVVHRKSGKRTQTYPDIEVVMRSGQRKIVQVKIEEKLNDPIVAKRLLRDRQVFEACGWEYEIWTDRYVKAEPRLQNLKNIHHFRGHDLASDIRDAIHAKLRDRAISTVRDLLNILPKENSENAVLSLLANHVMSVDLFKPITRDSSVFYLS